MLAAVAARGCSSALTATAATASVAEAEAEATSTGAGAGAARAESASRGCLRLIAPTKDFFSHFSVLSSFLFSSLFFFFHPLSRCLSVCLARFSLEILARRKGVFRAQRRRVSRGIELTDRPSDNGCDFSGG